MAPDSVCMHQAAGEANESQGYYDAAVREYREVLALGAGTARGSTSASAASLLLRAPAAVGAPTRRARGRRRRRSSRRSSRSIPRTPTPPTSSGRSHAQRESSTGPRELFESRRRALSRFRGGPHRPGPRAGRPGQGRAGARPRSRRRWPSTRRTTSPTTSSRRRTGRSANAAEQQKALAEFQRLRARKRERSDVDARCRPQVTKQELEPRSEPP